MMFDLTFLMIAVILILLPLLLLIIAVALAIGGLMPRGFESRLAFFGRSTRSLVRPKRKPVPWNWHPIDAHVYLGRLPRSEGDLEVLIDEGIGAIVTLNESWELKLPENVFKEKGIDWLHLPTPDYFSPTIADIHAAVLFIEYHETLGKKVYVHCNAGVGRSAVIAVAYLVHKNGWTLKEAYIYLKNKRSVVSIPSSNWSFRPHWRRLGKWYREIRRRRGISNQQEIKEENEIMGYLEPAILEDLRVTEKGLEEVLNDMRAEDPDVGSIVEVSRS